MFLGVLVGTLPILIGISLIAMSGTRAMMKKYMPKSVKVCPDCKTLLLNQPLLNRSRVAPGHHEDLMPMDRRGATAEPGRWGRFLAVAALVAVSAAGCASGTSASGPTASPATQAPAAQSSRAAPFSVGDVFAGIGNGRWNHFDARGTLLATLDDGRVGSAPYTPAHATTGMCFDPAGNMYGMNFAANSMSKFSNDGTLLADSVGSFNSLPESCLIVNGDTMFTSEVGGTGDILKLDLAGTQLANYDVRRSDWIDLAADQCTMFYSDEGPAIHRFNVCTNTSLPDFVTGGGAFFALRILPDGTVLAASRAAVKRFDSSGTPISSYSAAGENFFFALNIDPDGAHFWTGGLGGSTIYKFNLAPEGPPVLSFSPQIAAGGGTGLAGLAVFGELIASQPSPPTVPAVGPTLLLALLVLLGLIAVVALFARRRRQRRSALAGHPPPGGSIPG